MYSTRYIRDLTFETILDAVSEYDIFNKYINNFELERALNSPLRKDVKPSFVVFRTHYGRFKLGYIDNSTNDGGSCFDFVMKLFNCSYNDCLKLIDRDFSLGISDGKFKTYSKSIKTEYDSENSHSNITVAIRSWNNTTDKNYWSQYGINCSILNRYNVYPLSHFNINGNQYECKSITYGYYFGNNLWKIYSPLLTGRYKWLSNTNISIIQGYDQLPDMGEILVITKALKDVMLFDRINIPAVAPQSEGILIKEDKINEFKSRFKTIYINFDFDYIGVKTGNKYKRMYDIQPLYITNGRFGSINYGAKDASDYVKKHGLNELKRLLNL